MDHKDLKVYKDQLVAVVLKERLVLKAAKVLVEHRDQPVEVELQEYKDHSVQLEVKVQKV